LKKKQITCSGTLQNWGCLDAKYFQVHSILWFPLVFIHEYMTVKRSGLEMLHPEIIVQMLSVFNWTSDGSATAANKGLYTDLLICCWKHNVSSVERVLSQGVLS